MIGGMVANEDVGSLMLPSSLRHIEKDTMEAMWKVFVQIVHTWGAPDEDPLYQRSQWVEFMHVRTSQPPSYVGEYASAVAVLEELRRMYGDTMWQLLLFEHGANDQPNSRLAHLRTYVIEEFIRVWLASGGFKSFGAGNYNGYVSGSRFAIKPPYRFTPSSAQSPVAQTTGLK